MSFVFAEIYRLEPGQFSTCFCRFSSSLVASCYVARATRNGMIVAIAYNLDLKVFWTDNGCSINVMSSTTTTLRQK